MSDIFLFFPTLKRLNYPAPGLSIDFVAFMSHIDYVTGRSDVLL